MKKSFVLGAVLGSALLAAALIPNAARAADHYYDWELRQKRVDDTNASANVRLHFDFTKPLHGPWLMNPTYTSMTVSFIGRNAAAAGIEYRVKGTEPWTRRWQTAYGMIDYSKDMHAFHLSDLKPATEYEYRFISAATRYLTAYTDTVIGREIYSFKTLDPENDAYKVMVTSDVHGSLRLSLDDIYTATNGKEADFYIFLGDTVEDSMSEPRFYITSGFLDDIVRLWATSKPTIHVRGNHDAWGLHAADGWAEHFPRPDGRAHYAFSQGPALFVVLDTAAEAYHSGPRNSANQEVAEAYRAEQVEWLKELKKSGQWKTATFRIILNHYGMRTSPVGGDQFKRTSELFKDLLNDTSREGRTHLLLCGHEHRYARCLPRTKGVTCSPLAKPLKLRENQIAYPDAEDETYNFTEIGCTVCEAMSLDVTKDKLTITSYSNDGNAQILDRVEIFPDGSAKGAN